MASMWYQARGSMPRLLISLVDGLLDPTCGGHNGNIRTASGEPQTQLELFLRKLNRMRLSRSFILYIQSYGFIASSSMWKAVY